MATKTTGKTATKTAAERWREGTEHYQEAYAPVAKRIHEKAKEMDPNNPEAIVEMAIQETQDFAKKYHEDEAT